MDGPKLIEETRKRLNCSQEEVARATHAPGSPGITTGTLSRIERGLNTPTYWTVGQIAYALESLGATEAELRAIRDFKSWTRPLSDPESTR